MMYINLQVSNVFVPCMGFRTIVCPDSFVNFGSRNSLFVYLTSFLMFFLLYVFFLTYLLHLLSGLSTL